MRQARTWFSVGSLALLIVFTLPGHSLITAQEPVQRPHALVTKMPHLAFEVWPADFNEDGVTDLVAGTVSRDVVVRLGRGDGTFHDAIATASGFIPAGVGDLNHDGFIDVLATLSDGSGAGFILAGRGDGMFEPPRPGGITLGAPAQVVDVDGDGTRDVVSLVADAVRVYPGRRDFTFNTPTVLRIGLEPQNMIATDLNADGLVDVAAVTMTGRSVDVFLNAGGFVFTGVAIPLGHRGLGITARDLDRDGVVDLIASGGDLTGSVAPVWTSGFVFLLRGRGDGTFEPPAAFPTNNGPRSVVAGDFNGDGLVDLATGNLSYGYACEAFNHLWDSVSILPGRGDGLFGAPASFALGNSEGVEDVVLYRHAHHRLNTSDLNSDGRTDLIASPGAILLSTPPAENRLPVADAGPPMNVPSFERQTLSGSSSDEDNDWLTFAWTDHTGRVVGTVPRPCVSGYAGAQTFTLTVSDGRGGEAVSAVTHVFGSGQPPPGGWGSADIGNVGLAGGSSFDGVTYTVSASGSDIWGVNDEFHFVQRAASGPFDVAVRVTSVEAVHEWTKAGLMIRESLSPQSRHAFIFATPSAAPGVSFQRRDATGGATVHTSGPAIAAPVWLRLRREGDVVSAYARGSDNEAWAFVGTQTISGLSNSVYVGLALTSHVSGTRATARFDGLVLNPIVAVLPEAWTSKDIGAVGAVGQAGYESGTFTISATGADIWYTADAFHFVYQRFAGDFDVRARVAALAGPHEWAKAGLMMRTSEAAGASHHFLLASMQHGVAYQYRPVLDGPTYHIPVADGSAPAWFRIQRTSGTTVQLSYSPDGIAWTAVGSTSAAGELLVGLAVTSHDATQPATAAVDSVDVRRDADPWTGADVGAVAVPGSTAFDGRMYTIRANGRDIWGTFDAFHFTHQTLVGDGSVTARLSTLHGVDPWTKAGVMIRSSMDPSASHAFMFASLGKGLAFQRRVTDGALTLHTGGAVVPLPQWLRLTRTGTTITGSVSSDGLTWIDVGSETFPTLPVTVLAGLAVTSHDDSTLAAATFDGFRIQSAQTPPLAITAPSEGSALRTTAVTFEWTGPGDEFWLDVGTGPGRSDVYASGSLGAVTRHTVAALPLNGTTLHVQVRRRLGTITEAVGAVYTAPIRRALAVITDFQDRHFEDFGGAGMRSEDDLSRQLRQMEDHWAFLSRGLEVIRWEILRVELPYSSSDADPDPFDGNWVRFREAAARELLKQVQIADYDVNGDGALDVSWLVVSHGGLEITSAIGGSSRNLGVNMFVDGQASLSITSGATGNFNHEVAHLLGLPDTYGTYDTLHGLTLMSYSWPVPPHDFSAFERVRLGWVTPLQVTQTARSLWLPSAHDAMAAVVVPTGRPDEYFLLEYRRRPPSGYGSSSALEYNGLVVYHVLEGSNNFSYPPLVQLEPADGSNTYDGVLHLDDFLYPGNPALIDPDDPERLRPMIARSYFGSRPEIFRIENVAWRDGGIAFDIVIGE